MGVDYDAVYGIGVEVKHIEGDDSDMHEFLEEKLEDTKFSFRRSGEGNYTSEEDTFYIFIEDEYNIKDLSSRVKDLVSFLENNNIEYTGEVEVVGGLLVW